MKKKWVYSWPGRIAILLAGAVIGIIIVLTVFPAGSSSITSKGEITLTTEPLYQDGESPSQVYPDIEPGTQVTITDPAGTVLSVTHLVQGPSAFSSVVDTVIYTFTVTVPGGYKEYGVQVADDGVVWVPAGQMKSISLSPVS